MEVSATGTVDLAGPECCSEERIDDCAQKLKVCGHPMRLRILCRIAHGRRPCVSDLWSCLDQPQPVISQHLAVLKQKGIVESEVQGNRRVYRIVDPFIKLVLQSVDGEDTLLEKNLYEIRS
jgi:DNA-binding transcriptional ArsR family regulator